jgi:hypothetical protein
MVRPVQRLGLTEFAGDVVVVAVAEAEQDVVADVDFVRGRCCCRSARLP